MFFFFQFPPKFFSQVFQGKENEFYSGHQTVVSFSYSQWVSSQCKVNAARKQEDISHTAFSAGQGFSLLKKMVVPSMFQAKKPDSLQMSLKMLWILTCGSIPT